MKPTKRIRTVLYGDQRVSPAELEVLHTPAMQRLYGLRQLGLADRVFVDASHSRFHHVVGVLHQVEKLTSAIVGNLERSSRTFRLGSSSDKPQLVTAVELARQVRRRKPVIRLIGLLHDLTHAPFGHTVEDEIQLVESKHDEPDRQADAFYRLLCQLLAWLAVDVGVPLTTDLMRFLSQSGDPKTPEASIVGDLARQLLQVKPAAANASWRLQNEDIAHLLAHLNCAMTALLHLEVLHTQEPAKQQMPRPDGYAFQHAIQVALSEGPLASLLEDFRFNPHRDAYMLDVVGNTVCADLLDYAQRDSLFLGLRLAHDPDRIAENFTLVNWDASAYELERGSRRQVPEGMADPFEGWCLRTAISLFTHKYRTDVPSELMNLLNVRFYLYERAIYHPTKCAAGAMLGTALQLLGWRRRPAQEGRPELPSHLRFVGDDIFLYEVRSAARDMVDWCDKQDSRHVVNRADIEIAERAERQNGLVPALLKLRFGQSVASLLLELVAACGLLDRLGARRYLRPVFRALPSAQDSHLQVGAAGLAEVFRDPELRYESERRIEERANLPLGSVVIHCPRRTTAAKIANVLLVKPGVDADRVCKLRDIASLDSEIFGEHQKAIKAVEEMYASMWRLVVYAAPEQLIAHKEIAKAAGRVIFERMDKHGHFVDSDVAWSNDPSLDLELESKLAAHRGLPTDDYDGAPLTRFGMAVGRIADDLLERDHKLKTTLEGAADGLDSLPDGVRTRIEQALSVGITQPAPAVRSTRNSGREQNADRLDRFVAIARTYVRIGPKEIRELRQRYQPALAGLEEPEYNAVVSGLEEAIRATPANMTVHKGWKLNELLEVFDQLLRSKGIAWEGEAES